MPQLLEPALEVDDRVHAAGTVVQVQITGMCVAHCGGFGRPRGSVPRGKRRPTGRAGRRAMTPRRHSSPHRDAARYWNQPSMSMIALTVPALL